ncbi:hypothetical protein R75461_07230 [Paraburkholderia nemoris]|nr:hypothetical protein R75461_07230 [Paraburkholderia nemoris]
MTPPPVLAACCVCGTPCPDKFTGAARGWDWFTGYFDETVHFCPACRARRSSVHAHLLRISATTPLPPAHWHRLRDALERDLLPPRVRATRAHR